MEPATRAVRLAREPGPRRGPAAELLSKEMSGRTKTIDLGRLGLCAGEGRRLELPVAVDGLEFGGQRYEAEPPIVTTRLDVARTTGGGYSLRLRFRLRLTGPCMRCLEDAGRTLDVDAREVDQPGGGEDLDSPYLTADELDLRSWARDALALELPAQIVCRDDCLGICAVCGENLNRAAPEHHHARPRDSRFAKLSELRFNSTD